MDDVHHVRSGAGSYVKCLPSWCDRSLSAFRKNVAILADSLADSLDQHRAAIYNNDNH